MLQVATTTEGPAAAKVKAAILSSGKQVLLLPPPLLCLPQLPSSCLLGNRVCAGELS